ncbi:MAG: hypothetical protein ACM65M_04185 [Microcoleus sp.]
MKFYSVDLRQKIINVYENDATLEELCELLHEKIGVTVSRATMGRMTQRLKMTFKKKRSFRQPRAVKEFKTSDMSSGNK